MIRRSSLLLVVLMLLLVLVPASAAQSPGSSPWYAVVYQPQTEMLVWANALGWQGALPRPALPNEAEFRDLRISPDGRTMLLLSRRADGVEQLGVYDFASASLLQTHIAQAGEQINLGSRNIFSVNSQYFAVGLFGGDFTNPTWRVILFETATGNAVAFIDQTHPESPEVPLSAPIVQYVDGRSVHFQLVRQAVGASAVNPAYAWQVFGSDPTSPTLIESAYTRANADVLLLTGEVATTLKDEAYPTAPMEGQTPDFNVVARGYPRPDGVYQAAHVDSTRFHLTARWASGGSSILFYSTDPANGYYWNVIAAGGTPGNNAHRPLDSRITQAFGTSDGYLTVDESHLLAFYGQLGPEIAQPVMQLSPGDRIAYVTPIGITFTLAQLPGVGQPAVAATATVPAVVTPPPQVVTPPAPPALPVDCSQALPPRVAIGNHARVIPAAGSLNLRQQPNGAIITALAGGSDHASFWNYG